MIIATAREGGQGEIQEMSDFFTQADEPPIAGILHRQGTLFSHHFLTILAASLRGLRPLYIFKLSSCSVRPFML